MRTPAQDLEPAVRDPRKLRLTAFILVAIMVVGGSLIYFAYLKAAEKVANDPRPAVVSRLNKTKNFEFILQDRSAGQMSDFYGKVWLVCGISAKQPETWATTREVLKDMAKRYEDRDDFRILCITVDPDHENPDVLAKMAEEVGAKLPKWWFAAAGQEFVHKFLKNELRLEVIPTLKDGKWDYDPSITVIDRDLHLRKGTVQVSKHRRQSYPFNFEEAARLDREKSPADDPHRNMKKMEDLLIYVIDYTLSQPVTPS